MIRAFSYFSHLANIAEDRHHVRRRAIHERAGPPAGRLARDDASSGWPGAASAPPRSRARSTHAYISPVLTAHPTEVQRKSILDAERAIAELVGGARSRGTPTRARGNEALLHARVTQLWQTRHAALRRLTRRRRDRERAAATTAATFLTQIPRCTARSRSAARPPVATFFRMGNWIGGDRDGNPFVTADDAAHGARAPVRDGAALLPRPSCTSSAPSCRSRRTLAPVTPELQALAERSPDHSEHRADEPYRRALVGMYARLAATLHELTGTEALRHAVAPQNPYAAADELLADLRVIEQSLRAAPRAARSPRRGWHPLMRAVQVFGFHLATVDLRQSSDKHEAVIAELLAVARIEADYSALDEAGAPRAAAARCSTTRGRCAWSARRATATASSRAPSWRSSRPRVEMLRRYGREALRHYIISHTEAVSDLLEVLLLLKEVGLMRGTLGDRRGHGDLIVVPLFETIGDLRQAEPIMRAFYALPGHRRDGPGLGRRAGHHARLQRQQQGRRLLHQQLGALPRRDRAGRAVRRAAPRARHHAAPVPRPRRHGRPRRRPELPGDPGAAARHGERADPPDRAGRGDRARSTPTPRSAGATSRRWSRRRSRRRCCTPTQERAAGVPRGRRRAQRRQHGRLSQARLRDARASPTTSSARRRSARSPSSTSARGRPRARQAHGRRRSRTCARSRGASAGASAASACPAGTASARPSRPACGRRRRRSRSGSRSCSACTASGPSSARCCRTDMVLAKSDLGIAARYVELVEDRRLGKRIFARDPRRVGAHRGRARR